MLYPVATTPLLNELHGGEFTGMDRESFRAKYPEMWEEREQDKLEFRFPGAGSESYQDVIQRVRPIIVELERQVCATIYPLPKTKNVFHYEIYKDTIVVYKT